MPWSLPVLSACIVVKQFCRNNRLLFLKYFIPVILQIDFILFRQINLYITCNA